MKKIILTLPIIASLGVALVSCKTTSQDDLSTQRSDLETMSTQTEIFEKYNTTFTDETGKYLAQASVEVKEAEATTSTTYTSQKEASLSEDHYAIYIDNDYKDSLIKRTITSVNINNKDYTFTEAFKDVNEYLKSIVVTNLEYNNFIYSSEKSSILSALYSSDYGVQTLKLGDFEVDSKAAWSKSVSFSEACSFYNENLKDDATAYINLEIVYLPVFVKRVYSNREVLKSYLFVPVYETFVTNTGEIVKDDEGKVYTKASSISTVEAVDFEFDSNGSIKSSKDVETSTSTSTSAAN